MALITKPDMEFIWASGGAVVAPNDTKKQLGWVAEAPPFQYDNWLQNRQDQMLAHINQRGIPAWDGLTNYEAAGLSYVQGTNGVVYKSVAASGPATTVQDPTTDVSETYWKVALLEISELDSRYLSISYADVGQNIAIISAAGVTNWTVPAALQAGEVKATVQVIGGGGGGGGATASGAGSLSCGGGGAAGGYSEEVVDLTGVSSVSVTVGSGGTGGVGGVSDPLGGGASSFGAHLSSTGGAGGRTVGAGSSATFAASGNTPGIGAGGDINSRGAIGQQGIRLTGNDGYGGSGGASSISGGGAGQQTVGAGGAGSLGSGGGGALSLNGSGTANGGAGGAGLVVIRW